jgi:hypothetical protein
MNVSWDIELRADQLANPIVTCRDLGTMEDVGIPQTSVLESIFPGTGHQLKTWGRTPGILEMDPHWIGVRKATPLHTDPSYPRYSHQIILRADGLFLRGHNKIETPIHRGVFFVLDSHSPHQLCVKKRLPGMPPPWYVAVSLDTYDAGVTPEISIPMLLKYARNARLDV